MRPTARTGPPRRRVNGTLSDTAFSTGHDFDSVLEEQKRTKVLLGQVLIKMGVIKADHARAPLLVQKHLGITTEALQVAAGEWHLLGELLVQSGHITKEELAVAIAEQQQTGEKLGEVLKRCGLLTERQLNAVLEFQLNQIVAHASPLRLGELLVATGNITRQQLEEALHKQTISYKKLGEVLIDAGFTRPSRIKYGVRLQKMLLKAVL